MLTLVRFYHYIILFIIVLSIPSDAGRFTPGTTSVSNDSIQINISQVAGLQSLEDWQNASGSGLTLNAVNSSSQLGSVAQVTGLPGILNGINTTTSLNDTKINSTITERTTEFRTNDTIINGSIDRLQGIEDWRNTSASLGNTNLSVQLGSTAQVTGLVTALAGKEAVISVGTQSQFWRGNKTWGDIPTCIGTDKFTSTDGISITCSVDAGGSGGMPAQWNGSSNAMNYSLSNVTFDDFSGYNFTRIRIKFRGSNVNNVMNLTNYSQNVFGDNGHGLQYYSEINTSGGTMIAVVNANDSWDSADEIVGYRARGNFSIYKELQPNDIVFKIAAVAYLESGGGGTKQNEQVAYLQYDTDDRWDMSPTNYPAGKALLCTADPLIYRITCPVITNTSNTFISSMETIEFYQGGAPRNNTWHGANTMGMTFLGGFVPDPSGETELVLAKGAVFGQDNNLYHFKWYKQNQAGAAEGGFYSIYGGQGTNTAIEKFTVFNSSQRLKFQNSNGNGFTVEAGSVGDALGNATFDGALLPAANGTQSIGSQTQRWNDVWTKTQHVGDTILANGWRITEGENHGTDGIVFVAPNGTAYKPLMTQIN